MYTGYYERKEDHHLIIIGSPDPWFDCRLDAPEIGSVHTVAVSEYVGPDRAERGHITCRTLPDPGPDLIGGWPGNSDPHIRRYHGWRGTTDDYAIHAYGRRVLLGVTERKNGTHRWEFGPDLVPDLD